MWYLRNQDLTHFRLEDVNENFALRRKSQVTLFIQGHLEKYFMEVKHPGTQRPLQDGPRGLGYCCSWWQILWYMSSGHEKIEEF